MSISIANHVRIAIMRELEALADENEVTNTSDLNLYEIEDVIETVLDEMEWVAPEDSREAAEGLAEDFDGIEVGSNF